MQNVVDASNTTVGTKLKSTSGWYNAGNGTDAYGFRALPGGYVNGGSSILAGYIGYWWSATEYNATLARNWGMGYSYATVDRLPFSSHYEYQSCKHFTPKSDERNVAIASAAADAAESVVVYGTPARKAAWRITASSPLAPEPMGVLMRRAIFFSNSWSTILPGPSETLRTTST